MREESKESDVDKAERSEAPGGSEEGGTNHKARELMFGGEAMRFLLQHRVERTGARGLSTCVVRGSRALYERSPLAPALCRRTALSGEGWRLNNNKELIKDQDLAQHGAPGGPRDCEIRSWASNKILQDPTNESPESTNTIPEPSKIKE